MSAALWNVASRAAAVGSCTTKKPVISLESRAFAAPSRQTTHILHNQCTVDKRPRSIKVTNSSSCFAQTRFKS